MLNAHARAPSQTLPTAAEEVLCHDSESFYPARVAKLADARDLKSRVPKGTYRFDSGPGHQVEFLGDPSATLGISARGSDAAQTPQLDMGVEVRLG